MAAGSITVTTSVSVNLGLTDYSIAWVSDGAGAVNGYTFDARRGMVLEARFTPNTGGTKPSNNYAATLVDADGFNVLIGAGAALSDTNTANACPILLDGAGNSSSRLLFLDDGALELKITGAGAAKGGTLVLSVAERGDN